MLVYEPESFFVGNYVSCNTENVRSINIVSELL